MTSPGRDLGTDPLLVARDLTKHFPSKKGFLQRTHGYLQAVDGVDLTLARGETVGLVGESGCGKTTLSRLLLGLIELTAGQIIFKGDDVTDTRGEKRKLHRPEMQIVFQDPVGSLDPRKRVGSIVAEGLRAQKIGERSERQARASEMLEKVGLRPESADRFPHEFSGGQRQRIGIARALALNPELVIADEPVSALDVSIQAQILNLLVALKEEFHLTYLFVAHDLAVVGHISDRVAVMYLGRIVELGPTDQVLHNPRHPYSKALISAVLEPVVGASSGRQILQGDVPSPLEPPSGCRFRTRCPIAQEDCAHVDPELRTVGPNHTAACHYA